MTYHVADSLHIVTRISNVILVLGDVTDVFAKGSKVFAHVIYEDGDEEDQTLPTMKRLLIDQASGTRVSAASTISGARKRSAAGVHTTVRRPQLFHSTYNP